MFAKSPTPSTDEEKVSYHNYKFQPLNTSPSYSYVMNKFLNDKTNNQSYDEESTKSTYSNSLKSNKSRNSSNITSSSTRTTRTYELPDNILLQLEHQMLHSDLKRDSFRARNSSRHFALNPIFDEQYIQSKPQLPLSPLQPSLSSSPPTHDNDINLNKFYINSNNLSKPITTNDLNNNEIEYSPTSCVEVVYNTLEHIRKTNSLREMPRKNKFVTRNSNSFRRSNHFESD